MTCIVGGYLTKKALKAAVTAAPDAVLIQDPSIVRPRTFSARELKPNESCIVTNHPKRSWFAKIERKADGRLVVT